jgi:hypothetical protein
MVYAGKDTKESIDRVVSQTSLSRKQVVQAMNNERKRIKAQGYNDADLRLISTTGGLSKQLADIKRSLQACIDKKHRPSQLEDELSEVASMVV